MSVDCCDPIKACAFLHGNSFFQSILVRVGKKRGWKMRTSTKCNTTPVWAIVVATAATCSRLPVTQTHENPEKASIIIQENTHLSPWNLLRPRDVRQPANFEFSCQGKGGLVVATPWDANMDAEQKLKGRVSVDDGNNCTASATDRWWLAASLPVHVFRMIAKPDSGDG